MIHENWQGFNGGAWTESIDVRDFIQKNYTPYTGDESFLAGATERTKKLNDKYLALRQEELQKGGVLDIDRHSNLPDEEESAKANAEGA